MTRRDFIFALHCSAAAMLIPLHLSAQSSAKVWRIGLLETISMELNASNLDAFRRSLRDLGYVEGQNLIIEYRSAEGRGDRFADLAAGLQSGPQRIGQLNKLGSTLRKDEQL